MHHYRADVVWMCFEGGYLLRGVVIVDSQLEIVRAADYPVLPCNETTCSYRDVGEFESLDDGLSLV